MKNYKQKSSTRQPTSTRQSPMPTPIPKQKKNANGKKERQSFYKIEKELKELENMKSQMILNEINIYRTKRDIQNAS